MIARNGKAAAMASPTGPIEAMKVVRARGRWTPNSSPTNIIPCRDSIMEPETARPIESASDLMSWKEPRAVFAASASPVWKVAVLVCRSTLKYPNRLSHLVPLSTSKDGPVQRLPYIWSRALVNSQLSWPRGRGLVRERCTPQLLLKLGCRGRYSLDCFRAHDAPICTPIAQKDNHPLLRQHRVLLNDFHNHGGAAAVTNQVSPLEVPEKHRRCPTRRSWHGNGIVAGVTVQQIHAVFTPEDRFIKVCAHLRGADNKRCCALHYPTGVFVICRLERAQDAQRSGDALTLGARIRLAYDPRANVAQNSVRL